MFGPSKCPRLLAARARLAAHSKKHGREMNFEAMGRAAQDLRRKLRERRTSR
jgi:hypothetical protein